MTIQQLRATVDGADLNIALRRLGKCASAPRQTVPILAGVMIESDGPAGLLRLYSTDLDRQAVVTVPAHIEGGGRAVAMLAPLAAIVAKLEKGALVELTGTADSDDKNPKFQMAAGRFRASLAGFRAADFPVIPERAAAWSIQMRAGPLLALLASAAKDATPPGAGESLGARFSFAADGLTVTAGAGKMLTRRAYPLPRMLAGGLSFRPKDGAALVAHFEADAVKALADAIAKPGKGDGDGPAVTVGFAVDAGAVVAAMIDTGEAVVTVKAADGGRFPDMAALDAAPRLEWLAVEGDALAAALDSMSKGDAGKADNFTLSADGGRFTLHPAGGSAAVDLAAVAGADFHSVDSVGLPMLAARAAKGGGMVTVYQLAGDYAGRGLLAISRDDGALVYVSGFRETPAERFARAYGAAYAARDCAGMVAAVAAYRAGDGRCDDLAKLAAKARGMKPSKAAAAKEKGGGRCGYEGGFRDWQQRQETARLLAWYEARVTARGYDITRDRRDKLTLRPLDDGRAERLAAGIVGRWNIPAVMTEAQAARFHDLYAAGFDGKRGNVYYKGKGFRAKYYDQWLVMHPDGLAVPKVTRAGKAAPAPASAPEAVARPIVPEIVAEAASEPESAPAVAIEAAPGPDDDGDDVETREHQAGCPAVDGFGCRCGEGEAPAPVDDDAPAIPESREDYANSMQAPADDLVALVAELLARVAALESARPVADPVPVESPAPVPVDNAEAVDWQARALAAEESAASARRMYAMLEADKASFKAALAAMTADRDDWQAIAEQNTARLDAERKARADDERRILALVIARDKTAARLRGVRATARELEAMNGQAAAALAKARDDVNDALRGTLAAQGQVEELRDTLRRARMLQPIAGFRYAPAPQMPIVGGPAPAPGNVVRLGDRRAA